jgi:hypothetical protein
MANRNAKGVDEVVGNGRMPGFDDIPSLTTVRVVAKEKLR